MKFGKDRSTVERTMIEERAALPAGYTLTPAAGTHFVPVFLDDAKNVGVAACHVFEVGKPGAVHNVVLAYSPFDNNFAYWCGDSFIEGTAKDSPARRSKAVDFLASKGLKIGGTLRLHDGSGHKPSSGCGFFKSKEMMCKHCRAVFNHLAAQPGGISKALDNLVAESAPLSGGVAPAAPAAAPVAGFDPIMAKLKRYAFGLNVCLAGPKGWGKTHTVTAFAREGENEVEQLVYIGGHEGLESVDLIGHMIRTVDGSMAWKDGKLSEAFRKASLGFKTVVLFDEVLRVRSRELSVLVSSLTPHADGNLHLNTGRPLDVIDGLATEEVLSCSPENLWVVCTTNMGADYNVEDMDEALSDRFPIIVNVEPSADALREKLRPSMKAKGFSDGALNKLVDMYAAFRRLVDQGELTREMNLRHCSEVVRMAKAEGDLRELLLDRLPLWVERDVNGGLLRKQAEAITKLINTHFGK